MTRKNAIRMIIFAVLLVGLLTYMHLVFNFPKGEEGDLVRERFNTYYAQKRNSIDCIFIGSSGTDRYWLPALAFEDKGIASYEMTTGHQHVMFTKYLMKEALKRHDIKVFAVDLRTLTSKPESVNSIFIRRVTDNLHFSLNKIQATRNALKVVNEAGGKVDTEDMSYYYSPIKYHAEWNTLTNEDLTDLYPESELMGYVDYKYYYKSKPQTPTVVTDETAPLPEANIPIIDDLLEYCRGLDAEVIFFSTPMSADAETQAVINSAEKYVQDAGFRTFDFNTEEMYDTLDWDFALDMTNHNHCNVFGAVKFTRYMEDILVDDYGLEDHSSDDPDTYKDWTDGFDNIMELLEKRQPEYHDMLEATLEN